MQESNFFTRENVEWIAALVKEASTRTSDEKKTAKLRALEEKVRGVFIPSAFIMTSEEDIANLDSTLKTLEKLRVQYQSVRDLEAIVEYERLKKEMAGHLDFLATVKESLAMDAMVYEDYYKKELRNTLITDMLENSKTKMSMAAAEKKVELSEEYLHHKKQFFKIQRLALEVRTKYSFYIDLWKMVMQSCSYASRKGTQQ